MKLQHALLNSLPDLKAEADHRVANNLASLSAIVRLQSAAIRNGGQTYSALQVCSILQEIGTRIEVTAKLHAVLATSVDGEKIDLGNFIREVCQALETIAPRGQLDIDLKCHRAGLIESSVALHVGLLIAELVTNSAKYAHPTGLPVKIVLDCETQGTDGLILRFEDDGVGLPENFDPLKDGGLGFRLMRAAADSIKATLTFEHDELGLRCALARQSSHPTS